MSTCKPIISFEQFTFQYGQQQLTLSDITLSYIPWGKSANCWTKWFRKVDISSLYKWLIPFSYEGNSTGNVLIAGKDPREGSIFEQSKQVGTILQDQDAQFIGSMKKR